LLQLYHLFSHLILEKYYLCHDLYNNRNTSLLSIFIITSTNSHLLIYPSYLRSILYLKISAIRYKKICVLFRAILLHNERYQDWTFPAFQVFSLVYNKIRSMRIFFLRIVLFHDRVLEGFPYSEYVKFNGESTMKCRDEIRPEGDRGMQIPR